MVELSLQARGCLTVILLCCSNLFMTTAWYYHLKHDAWSMPKAIVLSWLIASMEYCLQVPANRIGHVSNGGPFSAPILKVIQECISLTAFGLFSTYVLREKLRWTDGAGFVLILVGVAVAMAGREMADRAAGGGAAAGGFPPPSVPGYQALTPDEGLDDHEGPGGVEMTDVRAATPPQGGGR